MSKLDILRIQKECCFVFSHLSVTDVLYIAYVSPLYVEIKVFCMSIMILCFPNIMNEETLLNIKRILTVLWF